MAFHSPVKTKSGRTVVPPISGLVEEHKNSVFELDKVLVVNVTDAVLSEVNLKEIKNEFKSSFNNYFRCHLNLLKYFEDNGVVEEKSKFCGRHISINKQCKEFSYALKWKLFSLGTDEYSELDGLSDFTSISRMSEVRRGRFEQIRTDSIALNEIKKKQLNVEHNEKLLEIKRKKIQLEQEENLERNEFKLRQLHLQQEFNENVLEDKSDVNIDNIHLDTRNRDPALSIANEVIHHNINIPTMNSDASPFVPARSGREIDPSSKYLAMCDLKKRPASQFRGESHLFLSWWNSLQARTIPLNPSPMDMLDILESHTVGPPNDLVKLYKTVHLSDPSQALHQVTEKMKKRYGNVDEISNNLRYQLSSFPIIKGNETSNYVGLILRDLADLCLLVHSQMNSVPDLQTLNYATGLNFIREKLPDFINSKWRQFKADFTESNGEHPPF